MTPERPRTSQPASPETRATQSSAGLHLDGFTTAIALAVVGLVGLLLTLVLTEPDQSQQPIDESHPAGVVHNYVLALLDNDPRQAYGYLSSEARRTLSYEQFAARPRPEPGRSRIQIEDERLEGDTARVTVRISRSHSGGFFPFRSEDYASERTVVLRRENAGWRISDAPPLLY